MVIFFYLPVAFSDSYDSGKNDRSESPWWQPASVIFIFRLIYSFYASSFPVASFFSGNTLHPSAARITAGTRSRPRSYKHKHHWYVKHAVFFPCFLEPACCSKEGRNSSQLVASTEQRPDFCVASYGQQGSRSRVIAIKYNILKT